MIFPFSTKIKDLIFGKLWNIGKGLTKAFHGDIILGETLLFVK